MKVYLLLVIGLFAISGLSSQVAVDEIKRNIFGNPFTDANQNYINLMAAAESNKVNEFLFDDWQPLSIEGTNGNIMQVDSANYHISADKIFFIESGDMYVLHNSVLEKAVLKNKVFKIIGGLNTEDEPHFFEVLSDGRFMLLKKYSLKSVNVSDHPMGIKDPNSQQLKQESRLYYYDSNRAYLDKLPRNKSKLIRIFGRGNNRMISFANKNDLSSRSEEDLIKLFDYYNETKE